LAAGGDLPRQITYKKTSDFERHVSGNMNIECTLFDSGINGLIIRGGEGESIEHLVKLLLLIKELKID
jgi:hypothetical protein